MEGHSSKRSRTIKNKTSSFFYPELVFWKTFSNNSSKNLNFFFEKWAEMSKKSFFFAIHWRNLTKIESYQGKYYNANKIVVYFKLKKNTVAQHILLLVSFLSKFGSQRFSLKTFNLLALVDEQIDFYLSLSHFCDLFSNFF